MGRPNQQPRSQPDEPLAAQTQIQLSDIPQTDDNSQVVILNIESQVSDTPMTTVQVFAIVSLTLRVVTWLCLLASLIILASNTSNIKLTRFTEIKVRFNNIYAYRYMMSAIVIGFAYTCVQVAFEIYQLATRKSLRRGNMLPKIIFYGDKFLLSILATGVGAAFGATVDLKKQLDQSDDILESIGVTLISQYRSKIDNFFNLAYVSATFLLIAFLSSVASSVLSSLALQKK
ncbi:CASP-like protein 4D1 [Bidens hawaiensis]|uniref:CASP-like protein 4D1 n=1 Tax=Bidens hawaiensis TaxID=980011 RepID=UPI00404ADBE2